MATLMLCWMLWGTVWGDPGQPFAYAWRAVEEFPSEHACTAALRSSTEARASLEMTEERQEGPPTVTTVPRMFQCQPCTEAAPKPMNAKKP